MQIYKEFTFEAAHMLPTAPEGHPNSRLHGHSFRARVVIDGRPDPESGVIFDFEDLTTAIEETRLKLDHHYLNEIEGLELPTLERISIWLWNELDQVVPGLFEIRIARDSCHEGCRYRGPTSGPEN